MTLKEEIMQSAWHEKDCPAHSNQMRPEKECYCIFSLISSALDRQKTKVLDIISDVIQEWDGNSATAFSKVIAQEIKDL